MTVLRQNTLGLSTPFYFKIVLLLVDNDQITMVKYDEIFIINVIFVLLC